MHEHQTALRASLSSPIAAATGLFRWTNSSFSVPSFQKLPGRVHGVITEIQRRQNRLYEDMLVTTFHDYPGTAALARSLAQSLSVLGRTDVRGGAIKKDWREALRPLEEWSRLYRQVDVAGEDTSSTMSSATHNGAPPSLLTPIHPHMAKRLGQHLELLMKKLVYTHTALISQIFDSMETRFGIPPSFDMHMTMLRHYAHFGYQEGSAEALRIVKSMNDRQLPWQETSEVYDLLLSSMSRRAGWRNEIRLLVDTMLANGILPKEETMHAAMLCAARSGDVMACSKYLERMHREWGLTPSERLKSILLYACAKRGDFQGAVEVFGQLMDHGHLTWTRSQEAHKRGGQGKDGGSRREEPYDHVLKGIKETEAQGNLDNALVNQSNLLLALINQSMAASKGRRRDHRQDRALIQEEVRSILRLFTMITNPSHPYAASTKVDSHLYTILMQYLSTLPSPLQGMRHLYEEMLKKNETKPNLVTYKILLDACAEQMDMESGQAYWNDMLQQGILPNKHVRASYVKGWCNVGEFAKAEESCRDALQFSLSTSDDAVEKARQVLQRQIQARIQTLSDSIGNSNMDTIQLRRLRSIRKRWMNERMILRQLARQQAEAFDISVVDTLMQGYVRHDMWHQACRVYEAVEQGLWGNTSRPTPKMLMTFFYCCGQGGFVQRAIDTFTRIESKVNGATAQQHPQRQVRPQHKKLMADKDGIEGGETMTSETMLPEMEWAQLLTDGTFFHYFGVLGRSHRAELLIPAWKSLLNLGIHPSQRTVGRLLDCLEDQQWGLGAIKQIQQDLTDNWPDQDWSHIIGDRSGGRLWR
ncbi:hypothetical protein BGW41_007657 [Actinomortierella wolfii]|nr:hypothetical protein BGW41_007657 [Actinomortierella wolfii]